MKLKVKQLIIAISVFVLIAVLIPLFVFFSRSPVLIVTEQTFVGFYGAERLRRETSLASFLLFRPVKNVFVANDTGDDIVSLAVSEISERPFCVLFPLRFARSAQLYRQQNPQNSVVILEGRYSENERPSAFAIGRNTSEYFLFKTDIDSDFYRAGMTAGAIVSSTADDNQYGRIVVFLESNLLSQARGAFLRGLNDFMIQERPPELQNTELILPATRFFTSFAQFSETSDISCVVLAGIGTEYIEKKTGVPVIFFTWLDPSFVPDDTVVVINDSPWVQAVEAVKMVSAGTMSGRIASEFSFLNTQRFDKRTLQKIKKTW
jgi:hypothetical protein